MLKIKDDVELNELEKYDYYFEEMYDAYVKYVDTGFHTIRIFVNVNNQHFKFGEIHCNSTSMFDCIFKEDRIEMLCKDLIQAKLVEKV